MLTLLIQEDFCLTILKTIVIRKLSQTKKRQIVKRTTMISLLYKEIEQVKNITKEIFDKVIEMFPEAGKIYKIIKEFKEIMFNKKENELDSWIKKTRALNYT